MGNVDQPVPPMDEECAAAWNHLVETQFGGRIPEITEELVPRAQAHKMPTRAMVLDQFPVTEEERSVPGLDAEITVSVFTPHDHEGTGPGIVWLHGGGMIAGHRFGAEAALQLALASGGVVVSVEYRMPPEYPDPTPVDDCYAALLWTADHAGELGIDPAALVLAGGSAGGGLAAGTALHVRDDGGPSLAGLLLLSPMLDDRMRTASAHMSGRLSWTRTSNETGWRALLGDRAGTDRVSSYAAPGRAVDVSRLPPTFIDVGSVDLFRDEDVAFATSIWASGGDAELHVWRGGIHGYEGYAPESRLTVETLAARERWLTRVLGR
ncbi:alpha/beta hydrolase [Pseudofrankia inefficax]|uniref:Alpha/beta hydrolase fold-3 domain protein n=1 Tax=Pseudofrankia inefficax (strain DSM 45817 / CECT 9037 / DDB 130130 / EuI1c) TaxID=298654 RepID=E3IXY0_PSEI1|nr:alpha/beta hydrolase fold domain-containing protein [Pseudofrankia inefficax]ADP81435.1 alpha/beta hydrolase fold-3 domain protein [Pseudofrankia inefficax]